MHQLIINGIPQVDNEGNPVLAFDTPAEEAAANANLAAIQAKEAADNEAANHKLYLIVGAVVAIFVGFLLVFGLN